MPLWNSSNNEKNTKTEEKLKLEKRKFLPVFIPHFSQRSRGGKDKKILSSVEAFREENFISPPIERRSWHTRSAQGTGKKCERPETKN